jgi:hypothetical protein
MEDWLRGATLAPCKVESSAECHRWKCVRLTRQGRRSARTSCASSDTRSDGYNAASSDGADCSSQLLNSGDF